MNAPENDPTGFERRLAAWLPAATKLDRDRMLFEAGRVSARAEAGSRLWASAVVGLALLLAGLGGLFARERSRRLALETILATRPLDRSEELAVVPPPIALPAPVAERPDRSSYFSLTSRLASGELDVPQVFPGPNAEQTPSSTGTRLPTLRPWGFERTLDF